MNKLFKKGRSYKMLSFVMALVMIFSLIPANTVHAEAQVIATATTLVAESGNGFLNDTEVSGKVVYDPAGAFLGKLRARVEFPADYVPTVGDVVTINYETNIPSLSAELGYDYDTTNARTMTSDQTSITFTIDEDDLAWFANNTSGYEAAVRFKQSSCPEDSYLAVSSVTVSREAAPVQPETPDQPDEPVEPDTPAEPETPDQPTQAAQPAMTLGRFGLGFNDVSAQYPNDFFATSYTTTTAWEAVVYNVANHDSTVHTKLEVVLTTSRDGMMFCVSDQTWSAIYPWTSLSAGTHVITIDFENNAEKLNFYFDSDAAYVSETEITAVVHSVRFLTANDAPTVLPDPETPDQPTQAAQPAMTLGRFGLGFNDVSAQYPNDFFATSYTTTTAWEAVVYNVANHDSTVHTKLEVVLTTSRDGMKFCVSDQTWSAIYPWTSLNAGTHVITIDFENNAEKLNFYFDSDAAYVSETEITAVVHSVRFLTENDTPTVLPDPETPNAPVEPEGPSESEVAVVLDSESGAFDLDADGRLYAAAGGKLRGALDFPEDFRVEAGGKLTINYDTDLPSFSAEFTYGNGGNATYFTKEFSAGQNALVIDIDEAWVSYFAGNTDYANNHTRARLKVDSTTGTYIDIVSVIYTPPGAVEDGEEDDASKPGVPSWKVNEGPTVTLETSSSVFTTKVNEDKSVDVSFTAPAGWTALRANIENCDYTTYPRVKIDITPAEGLYLYVYGDVDGDISGKYDFDSNKRTTIEFDLKRDTAYFDLWLNPQDGMGTAGQKDFIIHSIKIVDPSMPEGNFLNAPLSVESGAFTMDGTDTIRANDGGKLRARITLPADFRVEEGKQLAFYYDTNIDGLDIDFTWDWTDSSLANSTFKVDKKSQAFVIDQSWIDYINNNTTGTAPTVRLKLDSAPAGSYFTLKYVVYGDVSANQYNPEQVPQGLVVTYYDDIYSRGVAWNTDNTVETNALYYVKATSGMTAENIDWTSADVKVVTATSKDTTDTTGKTWRTFKAHVENLDAGAKYFYRAGNEATGWSEVGSFTIEKAASEITGFSFIHVTDSQEESSAGFQKWARVLKEAYNKAPGAAFVAHTGDIVNRSENKNNFYFQEWIYAFDEPMQQIMNGVFVPASGNHETLDYVFTDRFDIKWADYKEGDEELRYGGCYTVTYGEPENGLVVISLNNTAEAWNYETDFKLYQQVWLVEQLEKYSNYKWKVVQLHEGLMTAGDHTNDGEVEVMRDELPPIFAKYKVDLVLQGHDHVYTRTRSYAYGVNVFEPGTEANPNYYNGHTPVWSATETLAPGETSKDGSVTNTLDRTIYLEPSGTHYITINSCGTKQYPEEPADRIDEVIFEGDNPLHPTDANGNYGSMCQPGLPMFGIVTIEGDLLVYDSYTVDHNTRTSELYDSFAVSKANKSGYNTDNPHEGKEEVQLYGIKVETKAYDGYAPKLDVSGFVASNPAVADVTALKYTITSANDDGASYNQSATGPLFYGSNGKGIIPTQKGDYVLTVEIPQGNRFYWGSTSIKFSIK